MKRIIIGLILVGAALVSISSLFYHNRMSSETFYTTKNVKKFVLDDRNMPVEVVGVSGTKTSIRYKKSRDIKYNIKQTSNTLTLERRRTFGIGFSLFNFGERDQKIVIELPKAALEELQIETTNGNVTAKNLELENFDVETSNSKMTLMEIDSDTIDAETSNGKVELARMKFDDGTFETSNSKMDLQDLSFSEGEFQTSNGKITLSNLTPEKSLSLKTSNAKINGSVSGEKEEFSIDSKTSNGSNNLENSEGSPKELEVKTSNGSINIAFER